MYFQAVRGLTAASKISPRNSQLPERIERLRGKLLSEGIRSDLREVLERALKDLETVQNGI